MKKILPLLVTLIFKFLASQSQSISNPYGVPTSYANHILFSNSFRSSLTSVVLPAYDNVLLSENADSLENATGKGLHYFGQGNRNSIDLKSSAQYYNSNIENGKLWILKITSPTALGFQFYFSKFNIPDGAFLHIYAADSSRILGPYSSADNPDDSLRGIQFETQTIMGNEVYMEYFESDSSEFSGTIIIDNIIHIFRSPVSTDSGMRDPTDPSAWCQRDVACESGWGPEINSVGKVFIFDIYSNYLASATGTLLNNTAQDGIPYFLTAAHNLESLAPPYDLSTWEFGFDYENRTCMPPASGSDPFMHQLITGATLLTKDNLYSTGYPNTSDYLLLQLNATASDILNRGICYSGWSLTPPLSSPFFSSSDEFVFIHHPNADVKKFSKGNNLRASARLTPPWSHDDAYLLDITSGGALEVGSSGCPLYNNNHKIIATSSAIIPYEPATDYSPCYPATYEGQYFGRFDRDWVLGNFANWLDPVGKLNPSSASYSPFYDGPSSYCPNPPAEIIDPPVIDSYQQLSQGFKTNNKSGIPIFCSTDDNDHLTVTPLVGTQFYVDGYNKKVKCSTVTTFPGGSDLQTGCERITVVIPTSKCRCSYYSYYVSISELNYDLSFTGVNFNKTYDVHTWTDGIHGIPSFDIDVPDVLGHSLVPGRYYSIGVGTTVSGVWNAYNQVIYILPNSLTISNNSNVTTDIFSINDITIDNTTVSDPVNFVASQKITILPNSTLNAGEYFIEPVDCSAFRRPETNNNNNNTQLNSHTAKPNNYLWNEKPKIPNPQTENISITPNPNNGSFQIAVTKNDTPVGVKEIKVCDIMGSVIWQCGISAVNTFNVDISSYAKGIYYVKSINEFGEIEIKKLIKQ